MDRVPDDKESMWQTRCVSEDVVLRSNSEPWVGRSIERAEDASLLSGDARFIADLAPVPGICHAAILRSPHAHAEMRAIDASKHG
jgi:xanthine dehydrogenase molybdopterin-binding subunit B